MTGFEIAQVVFAVISVVQGISSAQAQKKGAKAAQADRDRAAQLQAERDRLARDQQRRQVNALARLQKADANNLAAQRRGGTVNFGDTLRQRTIQSALEGRLEDVAIAGNLSEQALAVSLSASANTASAQSSAASFSAFNAILGGFESLAGTANDAGLFTSDLGTSISPGVSPSDAPGTPF